MEREATGASSLVSTRLRRVAALRLEGSQEEKWDGLAREDERMLYETMRERIGASVDFMASFSSSGLDAKRPRSRSEGPDWPFDKLDPFMFPFGGRIEFEG